MEDFIFGTLATDELKLIYHRVARSGLQHADRIDPPDPHPGQPVTIVVTTAPDLHPEAVVCYYTTDGSEPRGARGQPGNGRVLRLDPVEPVWDTFLWGYLSQWRGELPAQPEEALVRYRIGAWSAAGPEIFADWPDAKATTDRAAEAFFHNRPINSPWVGDPQTGTSFCFSVDRLEPPQWAQEMVCYQIFVDRFFPGRGREWLQTSDLQGFHGGTLWGVLEKLDHVTELGTTCIWLSPVFPSPTTHGYDATDYLSVEQRLGGAPALRELVTAAHGRGIRILLDLVCNHLSNQHPFFVEAAANPHSRYRDWFSFDDSPLGYRAFFGVRSMPQLNLTNPEAREWMIGNARYWLEQFDIDGYRLDHANGPGPSFWSEFRRACKVAKPDSFSFGEIVEPVEVVQRYSGRLDGHLDFILADYLRRGFGDGQLSMPALEQFLDLHVARLDPGFLSLSFLDNHDMDRFLFLAGGDKQALRRVAALQMQLPSPPVIYYGTEVGMSQTTGKAGRAGLEASRAAMVWDGQQDLDLFSFYQDLIAERMVTRPWEASRAAPIELGVS